MSKTTHNTSDPQRDHSPDYDPSGRSFTAWIGGKSQLARQIIGLMPPHHCYCEVFAGAAWVLFKKTRAPVEIINDANGDLINLYRCIQHHLPEFARQFELMLISRDEYERQKQVDPSTLTDLQRAAASTICCGSAMAARLLATTWPSARTDHPPSAWPTSRPTCPPSMSASPTSWSKTSPTAGS